MFHIQYVTFACVKGKLPLSEVFSLRDSLYPMVILQMSLHNSDVYLKNYDIIIFYFQLSFTLLFSFLYFSYGALKLQLENPFLDIALVNSGIRFQ